MSLKGQDNKPYNFNLLTVFVSNLNVDAARRFSARGRSKNIANKIYWSIYSHTILVNETVNIVEDLFQTSY